MNTSHRTAFGTPRRKTDVHRAPWLASLVVLAALAASARSEGTPLSASVGTDYYTDSNDQRTVAALATVALGIGRGEGVVSTMRYDNDVVGAGVGITAGGAIPLGKAATLRGLATRLIGDGDYRAFKVKAGPTFQPAVDRSVALYYTHDESTVGPRADGVLAEAAFPLAPSLVGRATAGYAFTSDGSQGGQAGAGVGWSPIPHLELSGQVEIAPSIIATSGQIPGSGRGVLTLLNGGAGHGPDPQTNESLTVTALLGVRVPFHSHRPSGA